MELVTEKTHLLNDDGSRDFYQKSPSRDIDLEVGSVFDRHRLEQIERSGVRPWTWSEYITISGLGFFGILGAGGFIITVATVNSFSGMILAGCLSGVLSPSYTVWNMHQGRLRDTQIAIHQESANQVIDYRRKNSVLRDHISKMEVELSQIRIEVQLLDLVNTSLTKTTIALSKCHSMEKEVISTIREMCDQEMHILITQIGDLRSHERELITSLGELQKRERQLMSREVELYDANRILGAEIEDTLSRLTKDRASIAEKHRACGYVWRELIYLTSEDISKDDTIDLSISELRILAKRANDRAFNTRLLHEIQDLLESTYGQRSKGDYFNNIRLKIRYLIFTRSHYQDNYDVFLDAIRSDDLMKSKKDEEFRDRVNQLLQTAEKPRVEDIFSFLKE